MNFGGSIAKISITADDAVQSGNPIKVAPFGFGCVGAFLAHAVPPAQAETPQQGAVW